jgi:hypothetical protein
MANSIVPSNFLRFDSDGLELVVNSETGKAYASISAASRMLGVSKQALSKQITVNQINVINAQIQTATGLKTVNLMDSETLYDMAFEHNISLAKKMGAAGANLYMLKLAGYEVKVAETAPLTELDRAKAYVAALEAKAELEIINSQLVEENQQLSEAVDELFSYSSIIRIAKFNKCDEKLFNWRLLKNASNNLGTEVKKVPCPRYGTKSLYSHDAWRLAYPAFKLPETTTLVVRAA